MLWERHHLSSVSPQQLNLQRKAKTNKRQLFVCIINALEVKQLFSEESEKGFYWRPSPCLSTGCVVTCAELFKQPAGSGFTHTQTELVPRKLQQKQTRKFSPRNSRKYSSKLKTIVWEINIFASYQVTNNYQNSRKLEYLFAQFYSKSWIFTVCFQLVPLSACQSNTFNRSSQTSTASWPQSRYHWFQMQVTTNDCRHAFVHLANQRPCALLLIKYFILNLCPCMGSRVFAAPSGDFKHLHLSPSLPRCS